MKLLNCSLLMLLFLLAGCDQSTPVSTDPSGISVSSRMGAHPDAGFTRVLEAREFIFPEDHAAHPEYATEWWYFTGNLEHKEGARFGYQFTLFRVGLKAGEVVDNSSWRSHQLYMGHLAISDIQNRLHWSHERFARAAGGLAGAQTDPFRIWLGPWAIQGGDKQLFPLQLSAATPDFAIDLTLESGSKPIVLQGEKGFSRKAAGPGNASYYYSYTRLPTSGEIRIGEKNMRVTGNSWFDREWSSSALASDQAGWDWFSLQLADGRDLMFYRMRDREGNAQSFSNGVLVEQDGSLVSLSLESVRLLPLATWRSPLQTVYPVSWQLQIPQEQIDLRIDAAFEDQEMRHTVRYWEGAVRVTGSHQGVGYMELSGYAP